MKWISLPRFRMAYLLSGLSCLLISSCAADFAKNSNLKDGSQVAANVIYGSDGRLDLYQVTDDRLKALADSTVALVKTSDLIGKFVTLHERAGGRILNLIKSYEVTSQLGQVAVTGSYKLTVQDLAAVDKGTMNSWSVTFK